MIQEIRYTISFADLLKLNDIKVRRELEDGLSEFPLSYIALPLNVMGMGVPQMMGQTGEGHTQIQISNQFLQMRAIFDERYHNDREKCFQYAFSKIEAMEHLFRSMIPIRFSGVLVQNVRLVGTEPVEAINRGSVKLRERFFGFGKKFSYVQDERFFVNFDLSTSEGNALEKSVMVIVDINNRYASEIRKESAEEADIQKIRSIHESITDDVLDRLIQDGEMSV